MYDIASIPAGTQLTPSGVDAIFILTNANNHT